MKTAEELKSLRGEIETMNKKLAELTDEELAQVSGGIDLPDRSGGRAPDIIRQHNGVVSDGVVSGGVIDNTPEPSFIE